MRYGAFIYHGVKALLDVLRNDGIIQTKHTCFEEKKLSDVTGLTSMLDDSESDGEYEVVNISV